MTDMTLTLPDVTLRATVTGAGPTVLLLHAGRERRDVWAPVTEGMTECGLRTVAYDLRGHGESSGRATTLRAIADDVVEMVVREPAPIVVVGASLGGLAAVAALAEPSVAQRVAGLVLVDVVPDIDADRARRWLDDHGLLARETELTDDILASRSELHAIIAASDLPILLVRGGPRSPLGDADVDRLRMTNRRVTVTRVPDAGHLIARDAPAELARIVSAHATKWLGTDDVVRRAFELQRALGAEQIDHPGGPCSSTFAGCTPSRSNGTRRHEPGWRRSATRHSAPMGCRMPCCRARIAGGWITSSAPTRRRWCTSTAHAIARAPTASSADGPCP